MLEALCYRFALLAVQKTARTLPASEAKDTIIRYCVAALCENDE